jgi:DNA mismatch endonuclease (patch repair protein)
LAGGKATLNCNTVSKVAVRNDSRNSLYVTDVFSKTKRSRVMAAIRSTGNKDTELKLATIFRAHRITGWRRHQKLPGKPDFAFRRERLAVFVDGCFWHGCRWHCRMPKSRRDFWQPKIARNKARDKEDRRILGRLRWKVLRIWEHALNDPVKIAAVLRASLASGKKRHYNAR